MNRILLLACLLLILSSHTSFGRLAQIWVDGKYKLHGKVRSVICYEYIDDKYYGKTEEAYDKNGHLQTQNKSHQSTLQFQSIYARRRHTYTISTKDLVKGTTVVLLKRYRRWNLISETYRETDQQNRLQEYKIIKYQHHREAEYRSYGADSALKCHCTYIYTRENPYTPETVCDVSNDVNCPLATITNRYVRTKTNGFDNDLSEKYHKEYTKDSSGNITEVKEFNSLGEIVNQFRYSGFDEHGNWQIKEIAPGHYIRLEIEYY